MGEGSTATPPGTPFVPMTEEQIEEWRKHLTTNWQLPLVREHAHILCDMALASLSLPSPCGHPSQYAYSEDGGAHMVCLLCEREQRRYEDIEHEHLGCATAKIGIYAEREAKWPAVVGEAYARATRMVEYASTGKQMDVPDGFSPASLCLSKALLAVLTWPETKPCSAVTDISPEKMPRTFEYLLNAMEAAAQEKNPAEYGYADKRRAVFEHVEDLWDDYMRLLREKQDKLNSVASSTTAFKPTHRHADGGQYQRIGVGKVKMSDGWQPAVFYTEEGGALYATSMQRWDERFTPLDPTAASAITRGWPEATGDNARGGWRFDPKFLERVQEAMREEQATLEQIEAVLLAVNHMPDSDVSTR